MTARGLLGRVAAVAAVALFAVGAGASFAAGPSAHIDDVKIEPGYVELLLTTSNLPAGFSLKSAPIQVDADGAKLPARVSSQGRTTTAPRSSDRAAMVLLDTSGSMSYQDLAAAREAALDYAGALPADVRVGVITFADQAELVVKPTTNRAALGRGLDTVTPGGNTALYDAIHLGVSTLEGHGGSAQHRLVVLSDGVDTSSRTTLDATTKLLETRNVATDVVAFRYAAGETSSVRQLAAARGGRVLAANDTGQLSAVFTEIARSFTERASVLVGVPARLAETTARLTVTIGTGASAFSTSKQVTFAAAAAGAPAAVPGESGVFGWLPDWSWQMWLLAGLTFVSILLAVLLLIVVGRGEDTGKRALDQIAQYGPRRAAVRHEQPNENPFARTAVGWTEEVLRARGWEETVAERLDLASISMKPAEWTLLRICGCVVLFGLLLLLGMNFIVAVALGAVLGWLVTHLVVRIRISRRRSAFSDQLPDVLQLVAGSLQSGFSLAQALDAVVREDTQPAAGEFSRALAETRIGAELEDSLDRVAQRMASDDMRWIVMAIRIQREVGGNLAEVLLTTVSTMRERAQVRRQVRALTAEGRLSAYVLLGLPVGIAGFMLMVRPEYIAHLYTSLFGVLLIAVALLSMAIGAFWMSRLVQVEV